MNIQKLKDSKLASAYGIRCQGVQPWEGETECPLYTSVCVVGPGETARMHAHQEHEAFLIAQGRGRMTVDGESSEVGPGDVVYMRPFAGHELKNLDPDHDLLFYGLLWERLDEAAVQNDQETAGETPVPTLVTATPPTPNGDLHLGHLTGPYLRADVYTRYLRMRGGEAVYLTGVDDHQGYVEMAAPKEGKTPQRLAGDYGDAIEATLRAMEIDFDHYARPQSSPYHNETAQEFFKTLLEKGAIVAREAPTLFCEACDQFITEAEVNGTCPHCHESSDGNVCEACGRPNDCVDLLEPHCRKCGGIPTVRPKERFFFPLAPYEDHLREYLQRASMSTHVEALWAAMVADGLPEISVTRISQWGIPLGIPGHEDQRLYAWFEMAPGYLAAARELADKEGHGDAGWRHYWAGPEAHRIVHFFGYDNSYFHTILFPALFEAYDSSIRTPSAFVVNELYDYEGKKFSTSRRHAVWGRELLQWPGMTVDKARFYLAWDGPESRKTNFRKVDLEAVLERELVHGWEAWLRQLGRKVQEDFDGKLPGTGGWNGNQERFYKLLRDTVTEAEQSYTAAGFSLRRVTRALSRLVTAAQDFATAEVYWKGLPTRFEEWRTSLALEALAAKVLAMVAAPILPNFAAELWQALGYEGKPVWEPNPGFVPGGRDLSGLDRPFFSKAGSPSEVATPRPTAVSA